MARIEWIEYRLQNWSRWMLLTKLGGGNFARASTQERVDNGNGWDAPTVIPTNDAEATETNESVERLPSELKATVLEYYLGPGGNRAHLRKLACTEATMYARVDRAHRLLADHFMARKDRAKAERERVERLAASIRPGLAQ